MKKKLYITLIVITLVGLIGFFSYYIAKNELGKRREQAFDPASIDISQIDSDLEFAETIPEYRILFNGLVEESVELKFTDIIKQYGNETQVQRVHGIRSDGEEIDIEYTGMDINLILEDLGINEEAKNITIYATDLYAANFKLEETKEDFYLVWKKNGEYMNPSQDGVLKIAKHNGLTSKWVKNPVLFNFIAEFKDLVPEGDRETMEAIEFASEQSMFTLSISGSPEIDAEDWELRIGGLSDNTLGLSYEDIKSMPQESVYATLETISNPPGGPLIGNAVWEGVPFSHILELADYKESAVEVVFYCQDGYSTSITMEEARQEGVILAYKMNGRELSPVHGFPVRMVIPSKYGMKWAKWINQIEFVDYDYKGYWESRGWSDYAGRDQPDKRYD